MQVHTNPSSSASHPTSRKLEGPKARRSASGDLTKRGPTTFPGGDHGKHEGFNHGTKVIFRVSLLYDDNDIQRSKSIIIHDGKQESGAIYVVE